VQRNIVNAIGMEYHKVFVSGTGPTTLLPVPMAKLHTKAECLQSRAQKECTSPALDSLVSTCTNNTLVRHTSTTCRGFSACLLTIHRLQTKSMLKHSLHRCIDDSSRHIEHTPLSKPPRPPMRMSSLKKADRNGSQCRIGSS